MRPRKYVSNAKIRSKSKKKVKKNSGKTNQ